MEFKDVLLDLLNNNHITIQKLSKDTNIDDSVLYDYVHGSIPTVKYAVLLANYFNCTLNFLMGIDIEPNAYKFYNTYNIKLFPRRYAKLLSDNKITHFRLCKETMLNYSSYYAWRKGSIPSLSSLKIIAENLCTSIDYLIARKD